MFGSIYLLMPSASMATFHPVCLLVFIIDPLDLGEMHSQSAALRIVEVSGLIDQNFIAEVCQRSLAEGLFVHRSLLRWFLSFALVNVENLSDMSFLSRLRPVGEKIRTL